MTGGVKLEFPANTINEAVLAATERWRVLVEDPDAVLPWSTNVEFYEAPLTEVKDGRITDAGVQMMAQVRIEFDRKLVDELTGVNSASSATSEV
jgi:hypothetical protein